MPVKIILCHCKHEYQDKKYGRNMRLHNYAIKKNVWRCTICKTERG